MPWRLCVNKSILTLRYDVKWKSGWCPSDSAIAPIALMASKADWKFLAMNDFEIICLSDSGIGWRDQSGNVVSIRVWTCSNDKTAEASNPSQGTHFLLIEQVAILCVTILDDVTGTWKEWTWNRIPTNRMMAKVIGMNVLIRWYVDMLICWYVDTKLHLSTVIRQPRQSAALKYLLTL